MPLPVGPVTGGLDCGAPLPVFLQMFILKRFKSNVLEVLIPESLQACFWKCGFQRS